MDETTYNGWSNYATWRVNLEMFDGLDWDEEGTYESIADVADMLKERAEDAVTNYGDNETTQLPVSYALAFLGEVDYYEIAQRLIDEHPALIKKNEA